MGLLPDVASDLGASVPAAGHLISAYALGVVLGSPLIAMLAARAPRRALLIALAASFAVCNFRSEEHTSELQSRRDLVCRLLLEKKKKMRLRNNTVSEHTES